MMDLTFDWLRRNGTDIRVHGNGFLQINLPGNQRLHLFGHPDLPRQKAPTPVHDHRFGFYSLILSGTLVNVDWTFRTDEFTPPHSHFVCTFEASAKGGEDTALIPHRNRTGYLLKEGVNIYQSGQQYRIAPGAIHETFANEPTFTFVTKAENSPHIPRVFCRIGREPDNEFTRYDLAPDDLWQIVESAHREWLT